MTILYLFCGSSYFLAAAFLLGVLAFLGSAALAFFGDLAAFLTAGFFGVLAFFGLAAFFAAGFLAAVDFSAKQCYCIQKEYTFCILGGGNPLLFLLYLVPKEHSDLGSYCLQGNRQMMKHTVDMRCEWWEKGWPFACCGKMHLKMSSAEVVCCK